MPHACSHGSKLIIGVCDGMHWRKVFKTQRTNLCFHIQAILNWIRDGHFTMPEDATLNCLFKFKTKPSEGALQHLIDGRNLCRWFTNCIPPREVD